ncbi:OmpA family protein [Porticoccus litoralis]|jgi:outer membrane protein OmpA-like peptidoglycan-associated protein|uniref:OmpA family protein n=1 Tax=Porticoccus litoralis TaxID=434086 RepID=A0AAW8B1P4_9GAMM|nr:OmpA family protein [Porticoccus litoralis]MDP1519515.1 OmpA family protein [Porticoccus litoralis]
MKKLLLIALVGALTACMSTDPYTGQQKTSNTAKGAGIGAVTGAIIGAATSSDDDRKKGVITGAVAGAAVGGGVGYYMDRQEAALRAKLEGTGVRVVREGDSIRLVMPSNITFGVDRYEVRPEFYNTLESVALVLKEFNKTNIRIAGHTDSTGSSEYNQTLSERRAASVGQLLISQGIASGRVWTTGYGERYAIADNSTEYGRQANRRVELELVPIQ